MTSHKPSIEILNGSQRHRRRSFCTKLAIMQETYEPGAIVSLIARRQGVSPNQLLHWCKLILDGTLTATRADEEVVSTSQL